MKHRFSWTLLAAAVTLLVGAAAANAQVTAIRADVPFSFTAGNQSLPAGEYKFVVDPEHMLSRISDVNGSGVWLVRLVPGSSYRAASLGDKGMLTFLKYGQRYVLTGIWRAGTTSGNEVIGSRAPKEYARTPQLVEISESR